VTATISGAALARYDAVDPRLFTDPYPVYRAYRERESVHCGVSALVAYPGAWYVFRHADTVTVLKDPRFGDSSRLDGAARAFHPCGRQT
jgi:cytochrome P450